MSKRAQNKAVSWESCSALDESKKLSKGKSEPPSASVTPMMAQYTEIKAANPDCLLFYRMGDFYELFFEDAHVASRALGLTLTKRGKYLGKDIPMCGVPVHAADGYLQKLIRLGHKVAVCEQTEDPAEAKKRGSKAVVRREVIRLVTPGTLTEDSLLDASQNNFLTSLFRLPSDSACEDQYFALASADISTGEFIVTGIPGKDLPGELMRLQPSELIVGDQWINEANNLIAVSSLATTLTPVPGSYFDSKSGERDLKSVLGVALLDGFGEWTRSELAAIAALLKYIEITQIGQRPPLRPPVKTRENSVLVIDAATRNNLEIIKSNSGEKKGSLLGAIDRTVTGPGARELAAWLNSPLKNIDEIVRRQNVVSFFVEEADTRSRIRDVLKRAPDIARAYSRIVLSRGGPRDLGAIRTGLLVSEECLSCLQSVSNVLALPDYLDSITGRLSADCAFLITKLTNSLKSELPILKRDGGFVREGYREDLDEFRSLRDQSRQVIAQLQAKYAEETGIKSLKVRHNNVLGYFVEVTALNADALMSEPNNTRFIHRQTLANAVRFTTTELGEIEAKITTAGERAIAIEQEVFADLCVNVIAKEKELIDIASVLAELDTYCALAELAEAEALVRPVIDDSLSFNIKGGRHPVVEQALRQNNAGPFIENDCHLGSARDEPSTDNESQGERIWIVTGPNMAGKSTFLRQNALITILAQMGSFVPATSVHIGVVDRLFSRVGASDDLARGRSTFMVEMVETASILNQATNRSLVILDEIGRGTATFDGLSIAWATVEYLHSVSQCRALFATHYHELTALASKLNYASNATIEVKEWKDEIVFLHKVVSGSANRSYGIQVAKLAGLPKAVIERAGEVLRVLEESKDQTSADNLLDDLPLFAANRPKTYISNTSSGSLVEQAIERINPDELTPKQALEELYRLKDLRRNSSYNSDT